MLINFYENDESHATFLRVKLDEIDLKKGQIRSIYGDKVVF